VCWLLGPGIEIINEILGPFADPSASLPWLDELLEEPDAAFVRLLVGVGLVGAVRLIAALLLALAARVPGRSGVRAAWLSYCMSPTFARGYLHVLIGIGLGSWSGAVLSTPAIAATQVSASVVPAPVLAPPEATLRAWPDLGRPGTNVPSGPATQAPNSAVPQSWPDLGRPGINVPSSPSPDATTSPRQPTDPPRPRPAASHPTGHRGTADTAPDSTSPPGPATTPTPATPAPAKETVVAPGDCLWTLAERDLASRTQIEPSASDIATETQRWWQANRDSIGENPDRLVPGQRLRPPG
jgi:hypothetical protein